MTHNAEEMEIDFEPPHRRQDRIELVARSIRRSIPPGEPPTAIVPLGSRARKTRMWLPDSLNGYVTRCQRARTTCTCTCTS